MIYSHSRLSSYETCPRKYRYRYVDKVETEVEGIEAFMGKRVHEILERLYHHVARYGQPPSLAQIQQRFRREWAAGYHDQIRIVRDEHDADFYRRKGEGCLEHYYRANYPFDSGESVGIELDMRFSLDPGGRYEMRGIVDRLVRTGEGRYEIHDYKTGSMPPRAKFARDRQMPLYQIAVQQIYPDAEEVELVWHFVGLGRTIRARRTADELEQTRAETCSLIDKTRTVASFPGRKQPLCRWCEFNQICPVYREATTAPLSDPDDPGRGDLAGDEANGASGRSSPGAPVTGPRGQLSLF